MPLSSTAISAIAEDIESQLLERIDRSPWCTIAVDEFTDTDNKAILLVYVRYIRCSKSLGHI